MHRLAGFGFPASLDCQPPPSLPLKQGRSRRAFSRCFYGKLDLSLPLLQGAVFTLDVCTQILPHHKAALGLDPRAIRLMQSP